MCFVSNEKYSLKKKFEYINEHQIRFLFIETLVLWITIFIIRNMNACSCRYYYIVPCGVALYIYSKPICWLFVFEKTLSFTVHMQKVNDNCAEYMYILCSGIINFVCILIVRRFFFKFISNATPSDWIFRIIKKTVFLISFQCKNVHVICRKHDT